MDKKFGFGDAVIRVLPNGGDATSDIFTLGEQVDGTTTLLTSTGDVANLFAKGVNGPVLSRFGRKEVTLAGSFFLDPATLALLFPDSFTVVGDVMTSSATLSREILPVSFDITPAGEAPGTNSIYFPVARVSYNENIDFTLESAAQIDITFTITEDDAGTLYKVGEAIPTTTV